MYIYRLYRYTARPKSNEPIINAMSLHLCFSCCEKDVQNGGGGGGGLFLCVCLHLNVNLLLPRLSAGTSVCEPQQPDDITRRTRQPAQSAGNLHAHTQNNNNNIHCLHVMGYNFFMRTVE